MDSGTITTIIGIATTVLTPVVTALIKKAAPKIPKVLIPVIAGAIGGLGGTLTVIATHNAANSTLVALLGLAGVGLREVVDQLKQVGSDNPENPNA